MRVSVSDAEEAARKALGETGLCSEESGGLIEKCKGSERCAPGNIWENAQVLSQR